MSDAKESKAAVAHAETLSGEGLQQAPKGATEGGTEGAAAAVVPAGVPRAAVDDVTMTAVGHAPPPAAPVRGPGDALPVENWDRYELLQLLGRGGMGAVYKARDKRIDREVAIKFILSADAQMTRRFLQEARTQARLDHPNICKVLEVGEVEGKSYIAMQLVRGTPLDQLARSLTLDEKVEVMKTVAEATEAAHREGIIHRDIKPSNVVVERRKDAGGPDAKERVWPVLMDFGLAREAGEGQGLTETGTVMGTPSYMSPEQARGETRRVGVASDVYSLGATLFDVLVGTPPFIDDSAANILVKVLVEEPPRLRSRDSSLPEALEIIVDKCLRKELHLRYPSAGALAEDLGRFLSRQRPLARRQSMVSRLYWRARRNETMALAMLMLVATVIGFIGYGVHTVIANARREAMAQKRAELAQRLGQSVKDVEWIVRSAHLVPLHDTGPDKALVRRRMTEIEAEMRSFGESAAGLDHYALGRGHLALQEWDKALVELTKAESEGVREAELDYALGRVLGELYRRALEDARRSGDRSYFEKRRKELESELLAPALGRLERCRGLQTVSARYLDGLIDFYRGRYDAALRDAQAARADAPWLYEAPRLEGDVHMARALDARDRGDNEAAERSFGEAVARYEQAAEIGRSDHQIHEAIAEAWIRQEEMDMYRGRDPRPKLEKALEAADRSLRAAPRESDGDTKRAFAYHFQARFAQDHGAPRDEVERLYQTQIEAGQRAIARHPNDAYAHEITGSAYTKLAEYRLEQGQPVEPLLERAYGLLQDAIKLNPKSPWTYNDYGLALGLSGIKRKRRNEDPRDLFKQAIAMTKRASALDDQYLLAYNNTAFWLTELAGWQADHGEDPGDAVKDAVQMADRAIRINPQHPLAYGNAGLAFAIDASFRLDAGQDGRASARRAIERFDALLAIDKNIIVAWRDRARAFLLLANHEMAMGQSPQSQIADGLRTIERCYGIERGDGECQAIEAQLRMVQARWAHRSGAAPAAAAEQAARLARDAIRKFPERGDLWLVMAQICLDRIELEPTSGAAANAMVEEGLRASAEALRRAPGMPRALAVQGALYARGAQEQKNADRRDAMLERARASLAEALAADPMLKGRYGGMAAAKRPER